MTKIVGMNCAMNHTNDVEKRDKFHKGLNPFYSVMMVDNASDIKMVNAFAADNRGTNVIGRVYHVEEGGFHLPPKSKEDIAAKKRWTVDPADYFNMVNAFDPDVWAHIMNEPAGVPKDAEGEKILDDLCVWNTLYMDASIPKKRKSVLYNWGDRNPAIINGMWHERFKGNLRRMASYPDLFRVGMHFYGPDDLVAHLEAYVKTCEDVGITPIPVVGTEFGLDSDNGSVENGNRSRGVVGNEYAKWIAYVTNGPLAKYIKSGVLVGLCLFTWSNHPDWKNFDMQDDLDLQKALVDAVFVEKDTVPIIPKVFPFPADFETRSVERYVRSVGSSTFIRSQPNQKDSAYNGVIMFNGRRCDVILPENLKPEETVKQTIGKVEGIWLPIKVDSMQGFVLSSVIKLELITEKSITGEFSPVVKTDLNLPPPQEVAPLPPLSPVPATTITVPVVSVKKFTLQTFFVGTDEECRKAIEGINLLMQNAWKIEAVEVPPSPTK